VLGVVLGLVRAPRTLLAWVGGIGAAVLVIFAFAVRKLVARDGQGGYTVQFDPGFYIALLGLVAATVLNVGRRRTRSTASGREADHERDSG
jgi:chromate transport protein ChrA